MYFAGTLSEKYTYSQCTDVDLFPIFTLHYIAFDPLIKEMFDHFLNCKVMYFSFYGKQRSRGEER